jgi:hypothetical protein
MPVIRLPDGSERRFDAPVTVADVAMNIGAGLAKAALAGKVGGKVVDTSYLIEQDSDLAIITDKSMRVWSYSSLHRALIGVCGKRVVPRCASDDWPRD